MSVAGAARRFGRWKGRCSTIWTSGIGTLNPSCGPQTPISSSEKSSEFVNAFLTQDTSVTKITQNVTKIIIFRAGKGAPLSNVSGNEMAAANDTTPRIPVQPTTKIRRGDGRGVARFRKLREKIDKMYASR